MSSYTRMKKIFLRGLLWLYLFGFGYMALTLEPGFLDFDNLPDTNFTCVGKVIGGYYADLETNCQMFHVCTIGQLDEPMDIRFLCLNGTVFDQETRVCERVDEVDCTKSEHFYSLNLELYGNSQPTNLEENSETEQPLIIKSTLPPKTTTTTTEPTTKTTRPSYYSSSSANPVKSSTTQVLTHHFPVVNPNSADIRFNPEEINISLNPGAPPNIRTNPSFHSSNAGYSDKTNGYSDNKVVVTTHHSVFDSHSDKRKEAESVTQVPSGLKTVANVHGFSNRPTPSDINYDFSFTDSSELEGYQTENYQFQKEFRPSQQYSGPLHIPRPQHYQTTTFRPITTPKSTNYHQQKPATTTRNFYIQSLKPPVANQQNHYVQHQTEKSPQRIQLELPLLPSLPPLLFSSPAPFTLQHHIDAKRYTKEHVSPPRIIISASASVSDASGRRLNYSLGTIGAKILDEPPNSYDEYKETDVPLDPFYHDVPKIKLPKRSKRSIHVQEPLVEQHRKKRQAQFGLKHSDIIKSDEDAVNVLKFLFDWYRNEKTNPIRTTTSVSTALVPDEILTINDAFSTKPEESEIKISTGSSHENPLDVRFKASDLFNKKNKYSILGDDKYAVTHEEVKKVNEVQQNLSFSDTKISPQYSFIDDYVDDNYEPETYKSKFDLDDHFTDHDRFKYDSFLGDKFPSEDKNFKSKLYEKEEDKNRPIPKDYVDDNIEPLYYKERYGDGEEEQKVIEQRSSSEDKYSNKSQTVNEENKNIDSVREYNNEEDTTNIEQTESTEQMNNSEKEAGGQQHKEESVKDQKELEDVEQTTTQIEINDEPTTQVEQTKILSQAHLESIDIEEMVEITQKILTNKLVNQSKTSTKTEHAVQTHINDVPLTESFNNSTTTNETTTSNHTHNGQIEPLEYSTPTTDRRTTAFVDHTNLESETTLSSLQITSPSNVETLTTKVVVKPLEEEHKSEENYPQFIQLHTPKDEIQEVDIRKSEIISTSTNHQAVFHSTTSSTTDQSSHHTTEEEIRNKIAENTETNSIQVSPVSVISSTVNQSKPEVNILISKATKTNRTRTKTKGRGRRKFNEPEISFKNVLIEKLIEKPYRAKDDYDYLKTVSNVQSSTLIAEESSESSMKISIPINDSSTISSAIETTKSTRRRGRSRHKLEPTHARNVRRRRPSLNQIHADNITPSVSIISNHGASKHILDPVTIHNVPTTKVKKETTTDSHYGNETSSEPVMSNHEAHERNIVSSALTPNDVTTLSNVANNSEIPSVADKEPHSEILEITLSADPTEERKLDEILEITSPVASTVGKETDEIEHHYLSTVPPLVDTTQTTPIATLTDNLGTTTHTPTNPTFKVEAHSLIHNVATTPSTSSLDPFTQLDNIEEIYATSFVPTVKTHITKKKELKVELEEALTTTVDIETTQDIVELTTTWTSLIHDTTAESNNLHITTNNLPTQEESIQTTINNNPHNIEITTAEDSTSVDFDTTEIPTKKTTEQYEKSQESQAPKSLYVTERLQRMIDEIETTTKSLAAPVEKIPSDFNRKKYHRVNALKKEHQHKESTQTTINNNHHNIEINPAEDSTSVDLDTTEIPSKETTKQYEKSQESQAPKSIYVTEGFQRMLEEIETTTKSLAAPVEKIPSDYYRKRYHRVDTSKKEHQHKESIQTTINNNDHNIEITTAEDTTAVDLDTTEIPSEKTTKQYEKSQESQAPKSLYVTEGLQRMIEEIETTTKSLAAPVEKIPSDHYRKEYHRVDTLKKEHQPNGFTTTEALQPIQETTVEDIGITSNEIRDYSIKFEQKHNYKSHKDEKIPQTETYHKSNINSGTELPHYQMQASSTFEPETSTIISDLTPTTEAITTLPPDLSEVVTTSPVAHITESSTTTQRTIESRKRGRQPKRRTFKPQKTSYRHRFSTEVTSQPETRKETIEEEIISTIARTSKQLTTEPTRRIKKLRAHRTDIPLRKSASPTQSENFEESVLTTPLSRKTTVRKYYFFNCFNKEIDKFYPDPRDCRLFHYCTQGYTKNQLLDLKFVCDYNTFFDDENLVCTKKKPKRCL